MQSQHEPTQPVGHVASPVWGPLFVPWQRATFEEAQQCASTLCDSDFFLQPKNIGKVFGPGAMAFPHAHKRGEVYHPAIRIIRPGESEGTLHVILYENNGSMTDAMGFEDTATGARIDYSNGAPLEELYADAIKAHNAGERWRK